MRFVPNEYCLTVDGLSAEMADLLNCSGAWENHVVGITNGELASTVIDVLADGGTSFAVLHGLDDLRRGTVRSDVDLVVGDPPARLMHKLQGPFADRGLISTMVWRYDAGETRGFFLARDDLTGGVQLDLLHDPRGRGKYGIRTDHLLGGAGGSGWPYVGELAEIVYLLRKRLVKGQLEAATALVERARAYEPSDLEDKIDLVLVPRAARTVRDALGGDVRKSPSVTALPARWSRIAGRLLRPTGAWVHLQNASEADARIIADRLDGFLPRVEVATPGSAWWRWTVAEPLRRRPAVVVTFGSSYSGKPDVLVTAADSMEMARQTADGLGGLVEKRGDGA